MKKFVLSFVTITIVTASFAQTVFTYGKKTVSKEEFINAFNKNPSANIGRNKALKEYLNLYINFKLKVQAATDAGLDKDPTQQFELQNFKKQLADNIINEEANLNELVKQAFDRSQREIHLQQVFIEVPEKSDTVEAYKKIQSAYRQLKDGKDFATISEQYSSDDATKQSKGDLGYITAFTLPYQLENIVYSLPANSFSTPVKTKAGYHIFKNAGIRNSSGSRVIAQILVSIPPGASVEDKNRAAHKIDSLYALLKDGADFSTLASLASNDLSSSNNKGILPEFGVGTYNADFEKVAFGLQNKGDFSKPFQTSYGYHILTLLQIKPAATDLKDASTLSALQEKVVKDNRLELSKKEVIQKKLALIKFKPSEIRNEALFTFTDSAIKSDKVKPVNGLNENSSIFSFANQNVKAADWVRFVKNSRNTSYLTNKEYYRELYKDYMMAAADQYYRDHLEQYNSTFGKQVKEFKEANLLFAIMEKNVWGKANTDTAGLVQYYNLHKAKYQWPASADAIMVTCTNQTIASEVQQKIKSNPANWRQITGGNGTDVMADSSRYELTQLAIVDRSHFTSGLVTVPVKNQSDGSYTFNYIVKVYNEPGQRSFDEARGLVISDYQQILENNWLQELKKKYPVKVNELVFQTIK